MRHVRVIGNRTVKSIDGFLKSVEPGNFVQVGQTLMAIVTDRLWVVANFKETQLTHMRPGQPATIRVDAYPGVEFHGRVDSIQAGTGPTFSLFPPENATGNFVKIVQRVPSRSSSTGRPTPTTAWSWACRSNRR
jgi:membrane fusion protein (multidrug efflux system)